MKSKLSTLLPAILVVFLGSANYSLQAQFLSLTELDTSHFPQMVARIVLLDSVQKPVSSPLKSEFRLLENGVLNTNFSISTRDTINSAPSAVAFVLDHSGSMSDIMDLATNATKMQVLISAIDSVLLLTPNSSQSVYGCVSFNSYATLSCGLTKDLSKFESALAAIKPQGGTNYNDAFLSKTDGAITLLGTSSAALQRRMIFITDGQPDTNPNLDSISRMCLANDVRCDVIIINTIMNSALANISQQTGGKAYEVHTKSDLIFVLQLLLQDINSTQQNYLHWTSPYLCSESGRSRQLDVTFQRGFSAFTTSNYQAPIESVAALIPSSPNVMFGEIPINTSATKTINIVAKNAPFVIKGVGISPSGNFSILDAGAKHIGDTLFPGQSWILRIAYTQSQSHILDQANLVVSGDICPLIVPLTGGLNQVQVISPSESGSYSNCDSLVLRWSGFDSASSVNLYYSIDADQSNPHWILIATGVKGSSYLWRSPSTFPKLQFRVSGNSPQAYTWAQSLGSSGRDTARSITIDAAQHNLYVAGYYSDTLIARNTYQISSGGHDGFVSRIATDGTVIWTKSIAGTANDDARAVVCDAHGVDVCGSFQSATLNFPSTVVNRGPLDVCDFYVCHLDTSGNVVWVTTGGGTSLSAGYATADSIAYDHDSIYVYGTWKNHLSISGGSGTPGYTDLTSTSSNLLSFTAIFNSNGTVCSLKQGLLSQAYTKAQVQDSDGYQYEVGGFSGKLLSNPGAISLTSKGDVDVYVRRLSPPRQLIAHSDSSISIYGDPLLFTLGSLQCDGTTVGEYKLTILNGALKNTSNELALLSAFHVIGPDSAAFAVIDPQVGRLLAPYSATNISVSFHPMHDGLSTARLIVQSECFNDTIPVTGSATTASVASDFDASAITLSPNPAHDELHIRIPNHALSSTLQLQVLDILGDVVELRSIESANGSVDAVLNVSKYPRGLYTIQIRSSDSLVYRGLFLVD